MGYDRDEVLARTDLAELADHLVGPHKGRGRSASWPCPAPAHGSQTGKTPPLTVFTAPNGDERWKCHACGAGGTAADLVMTTQGLTFPEAIEVLARRAGVAPDEANGRSLRPARVRPPEPLPRGFVSPEVERYVAACEALLWTAPGAPMRRWLARRGFGEDVLRANRVGADPGPALVDRAPGLPRRGVGVVLPLLGPDDKAVYLQTRYVRADGHRYDNPSSVLVGPSPRMSEVRLPVPAANDNVVLVCEGIPDALTAAQAGHRAVAVLGAGYPDDRVARALVERFPSERLVLAFDADDRGRAGASKLDVALGELGAGSRVGLLEVPFAHGDLNAWLQMQEDRFPQELAEAVTKVVTPAQARGVLAESLSPLVASSGRTPDMRAPPTSVASSHGVSPQDEVDSPRPPAPGHPLESIYYRFILVDDPATVRANVASIEAALAIEELGPPSPQPPRSIGVDLELTLAELRYKHLLVDDPAIAGANLAHLKQEVSRWRDELDLAADRVPPLHSAALAESIAAIADASPTEPPDLGVAL